MSDGRNFYDHPINGIIKQYDEIRKVLTGYGDDYTTGCLLDYAYFKIAVDLSKQVFQGVVGGDTATKIRLYTILEQSKEAMLEFSKGTAKVL